MCEQEELFDWRRSALCIDEQTQLFVEVRESLQLGPDPKETAWYKLALRRRLRQSASTSDTRLQEAPNINTCVERVSEKGRERHLKDFRIWVRGPFIKILAKDCRIEFKLLHDVDVA